MESPSEEVPQTIEAPRRSWLVPQTIELASEVPQTMEVPQTIDVPQTIESPFDVPQTIESPDMIMSPLEIASPQMVCLNCVAVRRRTRDANTLDDVAGAVKKPPATTSSPAMLVVPNCLPCTSSTAAMAFTMPAPAPSIPASGMNELVN